MPEIYVLIPAQVAPQVAETTCKANEPIVNVLLDFDLYTLYVS